MTVRKPEGFADLADLPEDQRIEIIAHYVVEHRKTAAVCVDDEPGKPERYAEKLRAAGAVVVSQHKGPVAGVITLKVGPPHEH